MKRLLALVLSVIVVAGTFAAISCVGKEVAPTQAPTTPSPAEAPRKPQGTLVFAAATLGEEIWHPTKMGAYTASYISPVLESLIYWGVDGKLTPGLAEKWEVSADGLSYTFYLRKGIQFHDGYGELTADDVKWTFEKGTEKGTLNAFLNRLGPKVTSVNIVNPYQITFICKEAAVDFFTGIASPLPYFPIFCKKYFEKVGETEAARHPIGTGPYKFIEQKMGDYYKLEALNEHWRQVGYFKTLIMKVVPEEASRIAMLRSKEADVIDASIGFKKEILAGGLKIKSLSSTAGIGISLGGLYYPGHKSWDPSVPWVGPDPDKALKVRKALNLAINRQEILESLYLGEGTLGGVPPFFPGSPFYDPNWKPYPYDPEQAKKLLAEAGYPKGFTIDKMWLFQLGGRTELPAVGQAVAMYWDKIGVKTNLVPTEFGNIRVALSERKTVGITWPYGYIWSSEPFFFMGTIAYTKSSSNQGFENLDIDKLLEQANREPDLQKRIQIGNKIGQMIYDNYLWVPILAKNTIWGMGPNVGDWPLPPGALYTANWEYLKPAK